MDDIRDKPDIREAEEKIHNIAKFGSIILSHHCSRDSMGERGYDTNDLYKVLSEGKINDPPEYDEEYCDWKFKVEGKAIEGDEAVVITVIQSHRELFCITIWPK
jgi:hypothetical protein